MLHNPLTLGETSDKSVFAFPLRASMSKLIVCVFWISYNCHPIDLCHCFNIYAYNHSTLTYRFSRNLKPSSWRAPSTTVFPGFKIWYRLIKAELVYMQMLLNPLSLIVCGNSPFWHHLVSWDNNCTFTYSYFKSSLVQIMDFLWYEHCSSNPVNSWNFITFQKLRILNKKTDLV